MRLTSSPSISGSCTQLYPSEDPPRLSTDRGSYKDTTCYHILDVPRDLRELSSEIASDIHAAAPSLASLRRTSHARRVPHSPTAMEETVDEETINKQDCHSGEWQTVFRAYRNRAPGSNSAFKPLSAASVPAQPNASNVSAPPDAASATAGTASKEATQLLCTTRAVVQKSKQLAALPAGTIRVVFRPRGGLFLEKHPAASLLQALRTTVDGSLLGELHIRIHPTNNSFTVAIAEEATALALVKVQEIAIDGKQYPVAA
ncbi:hypothetical protein MTO96_021642 [Rhipicephalus appendiculatus]